MNKVIIGVLLAFGFSLSAFAQSTPPAATTSVPILPKVWTGVAGDTSIGAISRKNPLHYLHVVKLIKLKVGINRMRQEPSILFAKKDVTLSF